MSKENENFELGKLLGEGALKDLFESAWEKMNSVFEKKEELIKQSMFYGLKRMLDFYHDEENRETKALIEDVLYVSDSIYMLLNRLVSENTKYERLLTLPIKIECIQKDLDEIFGELKDGAKSKKSNQEWEEKLLKIENQLDEVFDLIDKFCEKRDESLEEGKDLEMEPEKKEILSKILLSRWSKYSNRKNGEVPFEREMLDFLLEMTEDILTKIGKDSN